MIFNNNDNNEMLFKYKPILYFIAI